MQKRQRRSAQLLERRAGQRGEGLAVQDIIPFRATRAANTYTLQTGCQAVKAPGFTPFTNIISIAEALIGMVSS